MYTLDRKTVLCYTVPILCVIHTKKGVTMNRYLPYIANAVGVLAVLLFVGSYQLKTRRHIILCNVLSRGLYVVQYLLLGAFSGAVLDVLGMGISLLAQKKDATFLRKRVPGGLATVIVLVDLTVIGMGLFLYENIYSLLPILGVLLHTGAFWLTKEKAIRRISFLGSPFWLVYNLASRAYGSAVGDVITMVSIALAILRYDVLGRKKPDA